MGSLPLEEAGLFHPGVCLRAFLASLGSKTHLGLLPVHRGLGVREWRPGIRKKISAQNRLWRTQPGSCPPAPSPTPGPPSMQVTIEDVQAQSGGMAQFQAVIEGNPQPTVIWYKVGAGLGKGLPAGEAVCGAPAGLGMALTEGQAGPWRWGPPGGTDGRPVLPCLQDGTQLGADPRLSQQQEGTTYSLVIRDVAQHDAGVYTCLAHNPGGQVLCKAELLIHGGEWGTTSQALSWLHAGVGGPLSSHRFRHRKLLQQTL